MWWLWLASVLWVAPLFWWCCCNACKGNYCDDIGAHGTLATKMTTGGACRTPRPTQATITISGVTNAFCTKCNELNGTWVADLTHYPGTGCFWATAVNHFSVPIFCSDFFFVVSIRCTGKVYVSFDPWIDGFDEGGWQNIANSAPAANCSTLGVLSMTLVHDYSAYCNYSGATITVELT